MRAVPACLRLGMLVAFVCAAAFAVPSMFGADPADRPGKPGPAAGRSTPSLREALARLKVPPPWFADTKVAWDAARPWKDGRFEIRRLLALGTTAGYRRGVKLTWLYRAKKDVGYGHEVPMYLFLAGETAWAVREYEAFLRRTPQRNTHAYLSLASCYGHFGEYGKAVETLKVAMAHLPTDHWRIARQADVHDTWGDLCASSGDKAGARRHYVKAMELYPKSTQPWGRHLLARRVATVKAKLDLLTEQLGVKGIPDGSYRGSSLGYAGPLTVTVAVRNGRITDLKVKHKEKIHQNATEIIPRRIIEAQSLKVDAITGATVTCQAIVEASLQALRKAPRR